MVEEGKAETVSNRIRWPATAVKSGIIMLTMAIKGEYHLLLMSDYVTQMAEVLCLSMLLPQRLKRLIILALEY